MTASPPPPLRAVLDHVAVAVPDVDAADRRWRDDLGGRWVTWTRNRVFVSRQLRFAGGGKLELIMPSPADTSPRNFVRRFLDRYGCAVHHVTFKVADLEAAIDHLRDAGFDVVDVDLSNRFWREAFLRPKQVGGIVVQVAWASHTDEEYAAGLGHTPEEPPPDAAQLLGPTLRHPDLAEAADVWAQLGGDVQDRGDDLLCTWPDSPLDVVVERGAPAGPTHLRFARTSALPAEDGVGPAVG